MVMAPARLRMANGALTCRLRRSVPICKLGQSMASKVSPKVTARKMYGSGCRRQVASSKRKKAVNIGGRA